jgi:hypothetical protein
MRSKEHTASLVDGTGENLLKKFEVKLVSILMNIVKPSLYGE